MAGPFKIQKFEAVYTGSAVHINPTFHCPYCANHPKNIVSKIWNVKVNQTLNFNGQLNFILPCCNNTINLYVAVYKAKGSSVIYASIGSEPIPLNWQVTL